MTRLKERYVNEVAKALQAKFGYANVMEIPKVEKVVINMGVSDAVADPKALDSAVRDLALIAGQKPQITRAKKSISNFFLK